MVTGIWGVCPAPLPEGGPLKLCDLTLVVQGWLDQGKHPTPEGQSDSLPELGWGSPGGQVNWQGWKTLAGRGGGRGREATYRSRNCLRETGSWAFTGCCPHHSFPILLEQAPTALTGLAQWIKCQPVNQSVSGLIPSQGTCLGCGPGPQWGHTRGNHTLMFLSLPSPLNK